MLDKLMGGNNISISQDKTEEKHKKSSYSLFDYVNKISSSYDRIQVENNYSEFMVNRLLSQNVDCILATGFANRTKFLDKQSHFDFLQRSITTKTKRYSKKVDNSLSELEDILLAILLSKKWECSVREAIINLSFSSKDEKINYIKKYQRILDEFFEFNSSYYLTPYNKEQIKTAIENLKGY